MTCENPYKHKLQKIVSIFNDMFSVDRKTSEEEMECMQFGICDYSPKKVEEIPYLHF